MTPSGDCLPNLLQEEITTSGGQIGGLTGVDYLIYGNITKFGARKTGLTVSTSKGVGSMLGRRARKASGGGLKTAKVTTEMGVDLKVTDVSTGQIVIADHVDGEIEHGKAFSIGGIESVNSTADPFASVQRVVAAKITEKIATYHIPIKVIKTQSDGTLIINYGEVFFKQGDKLAVFEKRVIHLSIRIPETYSDQMKSCWAWSKSLALNQDFPVQE